MSNYDPIDEALNTTGAIEVSNIPENDCVKKQDQLKNTSDDVKKDYDYTRANLYSLIEKGQESLNGIMELAGESASPRAYEVAGQIIKSVADTTDKLMELQKKIKDVDDQINKQPNNVTNNSLFVGSTSELSKLLKKGFLNNNTQTDNKKN
tara:strand:- start:8357 stop:8809 length:453 start_codon:yes stop_codon:yes gene_type:complete